MRFSEVTEQDNGGLIIINRFEIQNNIIILHEAKAE